MQKKLLGTVLLSVSAWASFGFADFAQQQQQQQQTNQGYTLDDLKKICASHEANRQIKPFVNHYRCEQQKTFWSDLNTTRYLLLNDAEVRFKAVVKDGMHESKWYQLPAPVCNQNASCTSKEQIRATLIYDVTIDSCEMLNKIDSLESFCNDNLKADWEQCTTEQHAAMARGPWMDPPAAHCMYEKTGAVKLCDAGETPQQQCQRQQQQQQQGPQQQHQQHQQQCSAVDFDSLEAAAFEPVEENMISADEIGADLRVVPVDLGFRHRNSDALLISSDVTRGSVLSSLGLKKGDIIVKIDNERVRTVGDFKRLIKGKKEIKVEYRNSDKKLVKITKKI